MCQVSRYINLFTDFGFKKIFGDPDNTDLLKSLLNDILGFAGERKIEKIIFKNGELLPEAPEERKAIIDLMCEDEKGHQFIVELQKVSQEHFQSRALNYTSFPIQQQGIKEIMYDKFNMIYLEIPKLKKTKEELSNHLEWWIYIFQNLHMMSDIPTELNSDVIKGTFKRAEFANMPKSEQENYHKNLKVYRDLVNSLDFAYKEGKQERSIEIAKKSLEKGLDMDTVAMITGLSVEEIEALR